ncbi:MAG: M20 family metallo-hydrolase [Bacteroidales bacterium]|nr:M20 family metallo-hydrolase [Bacteroidales bacterium]
MTEELYEQALTLLKELIATPSPSKQEENVAGVISNFMESKRIRVNRHLNNLWFVHPDFRAGRFTLLLNSHTDTVKPSSSWTFDPYSPTESNGRLYGLGSNDAGAPLVSLMATFLYFSQQKSIPLNLIFAATAEEEISGHHGIESIVDRLGNIDLAIVGEPTKMELAIAEKGLMVLDCKAKGRSGHAARNEGLNAIYEALTDIEWFRNYHFEKTSDVLGPVKMSVTQINAGIQHNVVPDACNFVVDVRTNEFYSNSQALQIIRDHVNCETEARSLRLNSSFIHPDHPFVKAARQMHIPCYGSPTTSDQAVMPYTSVKMGPGDSARSHTADEYIELAELKNGIETYIRLIEMMVENFEVKYERNQKQEDE